MEVPPAQTSGRRVCVQGEWQNEGAHSRALGSEFGSEPNLTPCANLRERIHYGAHFLHLQMKKKRKMVMMVMVVMIRMSHSYCYFED